MVEVNYFSLRRMQSILKKVEPDHAKLSENDHTDNEVEFFFEFVDQLMLLAEQELEINNGVL